MAFKANITIDQGTSFSTVLELTNEADIAIDTSIYTARAYLRKHYLSTSYIEFATDFTSNLLTLSLTPEQTANVDYGKYVFDVELVDSSSNTVVRILEGIALITPEATR